MKRVPAHLLVLLLAAGRVNAQDASTRTQAADLFTQGRSEMQAGRFAAACPKFEESQRLDPQIGTELNLANCFEQIGRIASAWALYVEVAEIAKQPEDRAFAEAAAGRLQRRVPHLEILTASIAGLEVRLDDAVVKPGLSRGVDPGPHKVMFSATGRLPRTVEVTATEGATLKVEVPALDIAPQPEPSPSQASVVQPNTSSELADDSDGDMARDDAVLSSERKVALAVGGAGVAALAVGLAFGWKAKSTWDDAHADGHCSSQDVCDDTGYGLIDEAYTSATVSTIIVGVGVAAIGAGAYLWITGAASQQEASRTAFAPLLRRELLGVQLEGRF